MALFAIPLALKVVGGALAVTGLFKAKSGYDKISGSKEKIAEAQNRHERNVKKFSADESSAIKTMDRLGELEIEIMASFNEYLDVMEKIYDRPVFEKGKCDKNDIPLFKKEDFKQATEGANTLLGGIGSAAAGAFASFAASGAITATTAALGTAGTGVAISGLSGAAAANAVFATLGGGTIAAGGGGIALGTAVLGYATFGVGLLIGGYFFESNADKSVKNADEAFANMLKAEDKISKCCNYLNVLKEYSERYEKALRKLFRKYQVELKKVKSLTNKQSNINYLKFSKSEKLMIENLVRIVDILYKMCNVQFVLKAKTDNEPNSVNTEEINNKLEQAKKEFPDVITDENEKELTYLPEVVYVICGENKTYRNKIIKFDTIIECAGELTFENCEIWYHRTHNTDKGQIKLIDDAKLVFQNCVLRCEAYSNTPLIFSVPNHGVPTVTVSNTEFYDCSEFVAAEYPAYRFKCVTIENSNFYNCINLMKRVELERGYHCRIANCKFEYTQIAAFYVSHSCKQKEGILNEFIYVSSGDFYLDDSQVDVSKDVNNTVNELKGVRGDEFFVGPDMSFYGQFHVKKSIFTGFSNWECLTSPTDVKDCTFKDCDMGIRALKRIADHCTFINCGEAVSNYTAEDVSVIRECRFIGKGKGHLLRISASKQYVCEIESCTFENMTVADDKSIILVDSISETENKLRIKNCTFKKIIVTPDAMRYRYGEEIRVGIVEIETIFEKVKDCDFVRFENCKFVDCEGYLVNCTADWSVQTNLFWGNGEGKVHAVGFTNCEGITTSGIAKR